METAAGSEAALLALTAALNLGVFASAVLVFTMQPGFMLLEAGSVSRKNALNNIFKNVFDVCIGGIVFYLVGYSILTGEALWMVEALSSLGLAKPPGPPSDAVPIADALYFFFQLGFASAAVTVSSGAVTGRISPYAYSVFSVFFVGFIYPTLGFVVWSDQGVLSGVFQDFAGAVVVHAAGAAAGLAGAILLGPRLGFNGYDPIGVGEERLYKVALTHAPHNMPLAALGVFLLWIGWFGFNGGTLLAAGAPPAPAGADPVAHVSGVMNAFGVIVMNTALAPCAAVAAAALLNIALREDINMPDLLNAVIAGLVGVTAAADVLTPSQAMLSGVAAALVFRLTRIVMARIPVDDPVSAISAHGFTGILGAGVVAFAAPAESAVAVLGLQLGYALAIFLAVFLASLIAFQLSAFICLASAAVIGGSRLRDSFRARGLRVHPSAEAYGLDDTLHGQDAYNFRSLR